MPASLTRIVGFHALHRLYRPDWSEAKNQEVFGPLSDAAGHGHDYRCAVTVTGPLDPATGMVMDLVELDTILHEEVVTALDGKYLNRDVPPFTSGRPLPTCEAIAAYVFEHVALRLPAGVRVERVRIIEDPTLYADYTGVP